MSEDYKFRCEVELESESGAYTEVIYGDTPDDLVSTLTEIGYAGRRVCFYAVTTDLPEGYVSSRGWVYS